MEGGGERVGGGRVGEMWGVRALMLLYGTHTQWRGGGGGGETDQWRRGREEQCMVAVNACV